MNEVLHESAFASSGRRCLNLSGRQSHPQAKATLSRQASSDKLHHRHVKSADVFQSVMKLLVVYRIWSPPDRAQSNGCYFIYYFFVCSLLGAPRCPNIFFFFFFLLGVFFFFPPPPCPGRKGRKTFLW